LQQQEEEDLDADAEGDEDVEGDDGEDDTTLYCFCHKQSFGDVRIPFLPKALADAFFFLP
jgi:chromatin modification-related protein YNG2